MVECSPMRRETRFERDYAEPEPPARVQRLHLTGAQRDERELNDLIASARILHRHERDAALQQAAWTALVAIGMIFIPGAGWMLFSIGLAARALWLVNGAWEAQTYLAGLPVN
jgi:hypothetical protein